MGRYRVNRQDLPMAQQETRLTLTLSRFEYDELQELAELTGTTGSKLGAIAIANWVQSPGFGSLLKRARDRRKAQAVLSPESVFVGIDANGDDQ